MDKRIILAVAGAGKTYTLGHEVDANKRNIVLAYTNQNVKNLKNEICDKYGGSIPANTQVLTFDSFLYRYFIRPYEKIILKFWNKCDVDMKGVEVNIKPEPKTIGGRYNRKYKDKNQFEHYVCKNKYYCSRIPELITYIKNKDINLFKIAMGNLNKYCDYILIDEVQDFREKYYDILEMIIKESSNVVLVGDYYQHSVNGQNNSGKPFKNCTYNQYIHNLEELGLEVDVTSLSKSRRCTKKICKLVREKLQIEIEAEEKNIEGEIFFLEEEDEIEKVLLDNNIIKLVYNNSGIYKFKAMGWGISKGDTLQDTCVILTGEYSNIKNEDFKLSSKECTTNNKLYVALTRAKNNVYIITKEIFDRHKENYLK